MSHYMSPLRHYYYFRYAYRYAAAISCYFHIDAVIIIDFAIAFR